MHAEVSQGSPEYPPWSHILVQSCGYWKSCRAHLQSGLKTLLGEYSYLHYVVKLGLADIVRSGRLPLMP